MTKFSVIAVTLIFLTGCESIQSNKTSQIDLPNVNVEQAFKEALSAATASGMSVVNADVQSRIIYAKKSGSRMLTFNDPQINIIVSGPVDRPQRARRVGRPRLPRQ